MTQSNHYFLRVIFFSVCNLCMFSSLVHSFPLPIRVERYEQKTILNIVTFMVIYFVSAYIFKMYTDYM